VEQSVDDGDAAKEYNINSQVTVKELPPLSQQKKKMGS
jgi:hypothetical protein